VPRLNQGISDKELDHAINVVIEKGGRKPNKTLALNVLLAVYEMMLENEDKFDGEMIRLALTKNNIRDKDERSLYASVVGIYYGKHGGYQQRSSSKKKKQNIPAHTPKKTYTVKKEMGGQLGWEI